MSSILEDQALELTKHETVCVEFEKLTIEQARRLLKIVYGENVENSTVRDPTMPAIKRLSWNSTIIANAEYDALQTIYSAVKTIKAEITKI